MKLSELLAQLQRTSELVSPDTEVFFSESFESKAFNGDRLPCGRENVTLHEVHGVIGFDYEKNEDISQVLILGDVLYPAKEGAAKREEPCPDCSRLPMYCSIHGK